MLNTEKLTQISIESEYRERDEKVVSRLCHECDNRTCTS